jgi:hypothetical protein
VYQDRFRICAVSDGFLFGAPGMIRTPDLLIRSQTLYPTELRAHVVSDRLGRLAEREGFEPSMQVLPTYSLSRGAPSAARPPLLDASRWRARTVWRRVRDSNPRTARAVNGFQDRRFQPLSQPSGQRRGTCRPRRRAVSATEYSRAASAVSTREERAAAALQRRDGRPKPPPGAASCALHETPGAERPRMRARPSQVAQSRPGQITSKRSQATSSDGPKA